MTTQHLTVLGRQPELSLAELEQVYGSDGLVHFSPTTALLPAPGFQIEQFGGIVKAGVVIFIGKNLTWVELSKKVIQHYRSQWADASGKRTIGISIYDWSVAPRDIQKTGLLIKSALKSRGVSVRLIPNSDAALSTATSHHNKLGLADNKIELLIARDDKGNVVVAESTGAQNITALARRDQGRPKRDAFVGMLPPKLALMMINLSGATKTLETCDRPNYILDPFCGTGVVLQEAALRGFDVYGTDLSDKMVDYSKQNIDWLKRNVDIESIDISQGDAQNHAWANIDQVSAIVAETYLGQPFSAPPAPDVLDKVVKIVDGITTNFLKNIHGQIEAGTPLCLAVPAWRSANGWFTYLPVIKQLESLGYEWQSLKSVNAQHLTYYREDQVVARQILLLKRK